MDIISFNEAATANGRIEKFIENPDSNSGIVTVPKTIASGETITIPDGRVAVLPNVQVDGTLNVEGEVFIPSGAGLSTVVQKSGDTMSGNLNFASGTKITGDFSNDTIGNRVVFQTSTSNSNTSVSAIPNGTATESYISVRNNSDAANASGTSLGVTAGASIIAAAKTGTGNYLPLAFVTSATERMRIDTSGNVGIGTTPVTKLHTQFPTLTIGSINEVVLQSKADASSSYTGNELTGITFTNWVNGYTAGSLSRASGIYGYNADVYKYGRYMGLSFYTSTLDNTASERMRIDHSGNVGIGTTTPAARLHNVSSASGGGAPATSGTVDANIGQRFQTGIVALDFGHYPTGEAWIQNRLFNSYANNFAIRLNPNGGDVVVSGGGGLGYGTGSGGTVTQLTSKSTTVTLNKPSGQIQMNNATLASNTAVEFLLTNSLITTNDNVYITFSGSQSNHYSYKAKAVAGGVYIIIKNESTGSLSEALVLNFAIIKGVTA